MNTLARALRSIGSGAVRFLKNLARASSPVPAMSRLNPRVALKPQRTKLTGLQIRWAKTQRNAGLTYRAGRSKYAPPELKTACALARFRAAGAL